MIKIMLRLELSPYYNVVNFNRKYLLSKNKLIRVYIIILKRCFMQKKLILMLLNACGLTIESNYD